MTGEASLAGLPVMAFVATAHPDQARAFYADILGLKLTAEDPFALTFDAGGTTLRVAIVDQLRPQPFTVLGWITSDIASTARVLAARGVAFTRYAWMQQDEQGVWTAPGGARVAWFTDPDGNTLSITQLT
jgi:catechol 2,3-dioxygenase-like lactoylglutathione lyase family enzyme